jgi:hypothetical protein
MYIYGMPQTVPLHYFRTHGVCDETSYPFADSVNVYCRSDEITPVENVKIVDSSFPSNRDSCIQKAIINKGPLCGGITWHPNPNSTKGHGMALVGYNTLHVGDTVRVFESVFGDTVVIRENDPRIGSTYWIYKNSYGLNYPYMPENQGYCYVLFVNTSLRLDNHYIKSPIIRAGHTDAEIICEDRDGDGYYNWGIGPKPATCPNTTQVRGDGDDSDPLLGEINTYGYCENLNPDERDTIFITSDSVTTDSSHVYNHIVVCNGATWTVSHSQTFHNGAKVFVREGAQLNTASSAVMRDADVRIISGTQMTMNGGSNYVRKSGKGFSVPPGATFRLQKGKIE